MEKNELYTCPCCGYKTLESETRGSFDICPICYWEDDNLQFEDPDYAGGANEDSLHNAQKNFLDFGASNKDYIDSVRKPTVEDKKDPNF